MAQNNPSGRGTAVLWCLAGGLRLTAGAVLFLLDESGRCKAELEARWEKIILINTAEVGFTMGGEKRGKDWENVPPQAVICDVFCDL